MIGGGRRIDRSGSHDPETMIRIDRSTKKWLADWSGWIVRSTIQDRILESIDRDPPINRDGSKKQEKHQKKEKKWKKHELKFWKKN